MNQNKLQSLDKNRRWLKSMTVVALLLLLFVGIAVGGTVAFLVDREDAIENTFTPSKVATYVLETTDNGVKSNVRIQNTGDTEAYIRAAIVVTWKDVDGNVYWKQPQADVDYIIKFAADGGWGVDVETSDGYYYYTKPVAPNDNNASTYTDETGVLIESCYPVAENIPEGYGLSVEILCSGIQSEPTNAVEDAWGVTVADNGTISK